MSAADSPKLSGDAEPLSERISRVFERAKHEALAMILEGAPPARPQSRAPDGDAVDEETRRLISQHRLISQKIYLTRKEAAIYLNVSDRSIAEWSARPADQNPFPEEHAGGDPRYKRARINEWTVRESKRQRPKPACGW